MAVDPELSEAVSRALRSTKLAVVSLSLPSALADVHGATVTLADHRPSVLIRQVRELRTARIDLPIVAVTHPSMKPHTATHVLRAGADDYVSLPLNRYELAARVLAVHERMFPRAAPVTDKLTRTEAAILRFLVENQGAWTPPGRIIQEAIGTHHEAGSSLVRVYVHKLRAKLAGSRIQVLSRRGYGYRVVTR